MEEALALGKALADERLDLGVATELERTRRTLELALGDRDVPVLTLPELNEIHFGSFDGGPLGDYRAWAWATDPAVDAPGLGESRAEAARRFARGLDVLLARPEDHVLVVSHALPIRYVLDAAESRIPTARIRPVANAVPHRLTEQQVANAAAALRSWAAAPRFADFPAEPDRQAVVDASDGA